MKKLGLSPWTMTISKNWSIRTYHVPHSFVYNAERTVGDEEQLFSMGHQVAQDHKCFIPSQDVLLRVLLNPRVQEASVISF